MPLLRRQQFSKQPLPENLRPNEELFYCKLTKEVFRDYDTFFERVILCNSLVWTCQLTGRPSLTYLEAVESEERARNSLAAIPVALKRTLLYLARLTKRGRLSDLCDDVFHFVKDRFFVGEEVEAAVDGDRRCCRVVKVLPPQPTRRKSSSSNAASTLANEARKSEEEIDLESSSEELDLTQCRYQVCDCDDPDRTLHILTAADVLRKKGVYSREKNRLFLKHTCENRNGQWFLKAKFIDKYNISEMKFGDIFAGRKPNLEAMANKKRPSSTSPMNNNCVAKPKNKESENKKKGETKTTPKKKGSNEKSPKTESVTKKKKLSQKENEMAALMEARQLLENRQRAREELKLKVEEERKKRKEEKDKEREKLREERRIIAACLREWQKPRDDLECDDLMDLPAPVPIDCGILNELFGDAVMVLEFVHNFSDQLSTKDSFPHEFTWDLLEKALVERDVHGPLNDLLQLLLRAIFAFQEDEEEAEDESRKHTWVSNSAVDLVGAESCNLDAAMAAKAAKATADWLAYYHGSLHKMTLDAFTLTEVLRLHLLTSGSRNVPVDNSSFSDPGVLLRLQDPELLGALATQTVFDISPEFKLKILVALSMQLLSYYSLRDEIEERLEKLRVAKQDLRTMQWAEQRREKEEAALKFKKKMEQRAAKLASAHEATSADATVANGRDGKSERVKAAKEKKTEEELRAEEEKQAAAEMKQKQEFLKKEKELADSVAKLMNRGAMFPLGRDRAYRRYWMFNALPGLFIEDDDDTVGTCLPQPTPYNPNSNPYTSFNNSITMARQKSGSGEQVHNASDKENEAGGQVGQNPNSGHRSHKLLSDNHPTLNGMLDPGVPKLAGLAGVKSELLNGEGADSDAKQTIFGMCNGEGDSCEVHGHRTCVRWGFYPTAGHVESLIGSLNPRGFREGCLKEILVAEKRRVVQSVARCPVSKLNSLVESGSVECPREPEVRKSNRLNVVPSYPEGTTMGDFLEMTFRDSVLEMEEKIYAGGLGSVRVKDRAAWREAIQQQSYDRQCEELTWGCRRAATPTKGPGNETLAVDSSTTLTNGIDHPEKEENVPAKEEFDVPATNVVHQLASALLQIYQGIEIKYLIALLAPDKEGELPSSKARHKSFAERWEDSLMSTSSLSQLFVHLATLEKCVAWSRSALNARCRICRRKKDAEHMLLCDGCDRGHHMYCLKPPLKEIPEGEWLCDVCNPKEKSHRKSRKPPRKEVEEEENEEDEEETVEEEEEEDDSGEEATEEESFRETRSSKRKRPIVESDCSSVSDGSSLDDKILNSDICEVCGKGGHLLCCDRCPLSYHLECVDPPLRRVPRGIWDCPRCLEYKPAAKRSKPTITLQRYTKLFTEERNPSRNRRDRQQRHSMDVKEESSSPRRSSRNAGRTVNYDKHSSVYDEDEWEVGGASLRKRSLRSVQIEIPDEEYYGMRKRQTPPSRRGASVDVPLNFKTCDQLLTEMVRSEDSWPFLRPVGKKELPMYHELVKRPMDFGTMRSKLNAMSYQNNKEFVSDVFLVFQNCILYNPIASIQYKAADRLGKMFSGRVQELKLNLSTPEAALLHPRNGICVVGAGRRKRLRRRIVSEEEEEEEAGAEKEPTAESENGDEVLLNGAGEETSEDETTITEPPSNAESEVLEQSSECSDATMAEEAMEEEEQEMEEEANSDSKEMEDA